MDDEFACQVDNLDRTAHVEDKDFSSLAHSASFEDESTGFGYEHEVAYDVRMCHCNGSAQFYLLLEEWDDGTIGAEDIAKARGDKLCVFGLVFLL